MKNFKSILAIFLIGIIYFVSVIFYKPYNDFYLLQEGDAQGYYMYLPAIFIYHDLPDLRKTTAAKFSHCIPGRKVEDHYVNKYFMGTAVLQAPFFFAAHILSICTGRVHDGFTMTYMYAAQLSNDVYTILGLFIVMLILRRRFSDGVTAIVLVLIGLGTNLYYLAAHMPFCHPYLFFWYALLLLLTGYFYDTYRRRYILLTGIVCGMIILTRFNELYVILIPILWGIRSRADIAGRLNLFKKNIVPIIAAAALMVLCIIPQCIYWKVSSGHFLYYSYTGEQFDFLHPHILDGFFSGSNGWLMYSPIMILALAGIIFTVRRRDTAYLPLLVFLSVHIYVIYSWWCWFYMGSYGSRPMAEAYPLLSIPMAYTVEWFWQSWFKKMLLIAISGFCIWLLQFQSYQSDLGIFNSELSNWHYNLITLGKSKITYEESVVLNTQEFQPCHPVFVKTLGENNFENATADGSDTTVFTSGRRSVCVRLNKSIMGYSSTLGAIGAHPGQWIKASVNCLAKERTDHNWHLSPLVIACAHGKYTKWRCVGLQNKINNPKHLIWHFPINEWGHVYFYSQIPRDMKPTDNILVYVEHTSGPDIYIDDMKVELYDGK